MMRPTHTLPAARRRDDVMLHPTNAPVPVRPGGRRKPPLEARGPWDPWLPLREASPDIPRPLATMATALLVTILTLFLLLYFAGVLGGTVTP